MLNVNNISKIYGNFSVLKDVSFQAEAGDVIGIIGANGCGKSTLLKIISGIVAPTAGEVSYEGALSSLLEIGSGIHPDLTGKANYFLKGGILGIGKRELQAKYEQLVAFTELGDWLDQPVKNYSNGMYMRLAFGIALALDADIYLFDEILSVGDAPFQQKCLRTIEELSDKGKIILMVSHNMSEITNHCSRVLWLNEQKVVLGDVSEDIIGDYLSSAFNKPHDLPHRLEDVVINDLVLQPDSVVTGNEPLEIRLDLHIAKPLQNFQVTVHIQDQQSIPIFSVSTATANDWSTPGIGNHVLAVTIPANFLNQGIYTLSFYLHIEKQVHQIRNLTFFRVTDDAQNNQLFSGKIKTNLGWKLK
ncbi:ABC transporter ATP-binding protein [Marinoscillum furvescens]|uniref:Lipopolysaccharide transport system ATP-binding protein n=1 Tax=Marinoscillum furvescens DSM 4134 TaxID=1122208 RepID=A0A3D9KY69_MARFU|nr:ABC transporter ATP-binding protein [Marinoscillum furvescens]RED92312.1 lipopolysaccharide transport system ATP-binding protein [Marinoscillum furvescens DSM 4134]